MTPPATNEIEIVAEGLAFPEGPIAFPDGSLVVVEVRGERLTRLRNGRHETVARLPGGPNGAAVGPDGAIYVCNNGGAIWSGDPHLDLPIGLPPGFEGGWIERVEPATGRVDRLYTHVDGHHLSAPNDLVFDRDGGFWFTDYGKDHPRHRAISGLYYARPDGSSIVEAAYGFTGLNGVGLSPDETVLYCNETATQRVWAFDLDAPGRIRPGGPFGPQRLVATLPGLQPIDSLAVDAQGHICAGTLLNGGITRIAPDGTMMHVPMPDPMPTNICFGGSDLQDAYVTLSARGAVAKLRWPCPGLALNFLS